MKITSEKHDVEVSGAQASNTFAIKTSPQAFQLLSSGLYTNKIKAVLRELGCNAVDAHVAAGVPEKPIEVKLPNANDKQFFVKDYGTGLSDEQVMRLYTTYFDSTKQQSDNFIGGFGVGSKSPFAYTDSFTVESRFDGMKRLYTAYVNEDGIPTITRMFEEKTDEPNGLTIGFPVKPEDVRQFYAEAVETYKWFPVPPVIRGSDLKFENLEAKRLGDLWLTKTQGYGNYESQVRMGSVAYPIGNLFREIKNAPDATKVSEEDKISLDAVESLVHNRQWVFDLPIGSSLVAASREALQFDKKSIVSLRDNIVKLANKAAEELHNDIQATSKNIREYVNNARKFTDTYNLYRSSSFLSLLSKHNPNYNTAGIKISQSEYPSLQLVSTSGLFTIREFYSGLRQKAKLNKSLDNDEIQRRVRRKVTKSFNENGKVADFEAISEFIWDLDAKNINVWPFEYTDLSLNEVIDFSIGACNKAYETGNFNHLIAMKPGVSEADFKKDLDKLKKYLDLKSESLERPIKPPPKKMIKTEDIFWVTVMESISSGINYKGSTDLRKLSRQRMVTSEITSIVEEDSDVAYVVFDKKALPNTPHAPAEIYSGAVNLLRNVETLRKLTETRKIIDKIIPSDGVVMVEKTDVDTFLKMCPDAKPLNDVINTIKKDKSLLNEVKKEIANLPNAVYGSNEVNNYIRYHNHAIESFKEKGQTLDLSNTTIGKIVANWQTLIDQSSKSSNMRENLTYVIQTGAHLCGWKGLTLPDTINFNDDVKKIANTYPMLGLVHYYSSTGNGDILGKYFLDVAELEMYRENAYNTTISI